MGIFLVPLLVILIGLVCYIIWHSYNALKTIFSILKLQNEVIDQIIDLLKGGE